MIASSGSEPRTSKAGSAEFVDADDLGHALATLGARGPDVTVLAGGTDVMVQYLRGDIHPRILLHVRRLPELRGIQGEDRTVIGAATTHWQLATDPGIRTGHPAVVEAALTVGGRQTQNVGTLGGNVVNASPAADLLPALLVSDARVTLVGPSGERELPVVDFVLGRRTTAREPDELVRSLSLEPAGQGTGETYLKVGRRAAMEVAVVGLAARLTFDADGTVTGARIAACSVAPRPFRARESEQRVLGSRLEEEAIRESGELLQRAASPVDDARATAAYRRAVLAPLLRRALAACRERSGVNER